MASAGSIFVDLLLRDNQYSAGWNKARNQTRQSTSQIGKDVNQLGKSFEGVLDPINNISASIKSLGGVIAGALSVQKVIQYSDVWKQLSGRLAIVEGDLSNVVKTQQDLFEIAQKNRQPLESVLSFYSRLKQFIPETERAQYDLLGVTESVTAALAITGETSASATGALIQFTQAIGTNFEAAGQELRSLQEQAPRLTQALMKALGDGTKSLQQLKNEGKLTRESVLNALSGAGEEGRKLAEELAKVPITVSQAFTQLDNAFLKFIGQSKAVESGTSSLVIGIQALAANLDLVANAIIITSAVFVARLVPGLIASAAAFVAAQRQAILYQAALARMAGVSAAAATSITALGGALSLVGGAAGAAFLAAGAAVYYLSTAQSQADQINEKYSEQLERIRNNASFATQEINGVSVSIEDMSNTIARNAALKELRKELDDVEGSARQLSVTLRNFTVDTGDLFGDLADSISNSFSILKLAFTDRETFGAVRELQEEFRKTGDVDAYASALQRLADKSPAVNKIYESVLNQIQAFRVAGLAADDLAAQIYNLSGDGPPIPGRKPNVPTSRNGNRTGNSTGTGTGRERVDQIEKFLVKQREALITLQQEADYIGLTTVEVEKLKDARKFDAQVAEKSLALKGQELIKFKEQTDAIRLLRQEAIETNYELSRSASTGASEFFKKYEEDATNAAKNVQSVLETAFKGAENAFVEFTKTGKLNFKDLANSIIEDLIRIQFRRAAANLVDIALGSVGSFIGADSFGATSGATSTTVSLGPSDFFADGGYIKPGTYGVAGEAGAELIYGGKTGVSVFNQDQLGSRGNTYNIDARGADQGAVARLEQALFALAGPGVIEQRVSNAQIRGAL